MREGWIETTLGEVADVIDPHPSHRAPPEHDGGVPFIGIGDVRDGGRTDFDKARKVSPGVLEEHAVRYDRKQRLIGLGRVASIGLVVRLPTGGIDYAVSPTLAVLRPRSIDTDFLFYFLQADYLQEQLQTFKRGSTRQSVGMLTLRELKVAFPSLVEQKRIVDVVSSVDAYIDALQQQADKARTARNAVLHELLSAGGDDWTETTVGSRCVVKGGKRLPKGTPWAVNPTAHPYIRATDFRGGQIDTSNLVYVPDDVWPVVSRYVVQAGDVLITIAGTIGAVALTPNTHIGANLTENAALIRPMDETLNSHFLHLWLMSDTAQRQITDLTIGTTQQKLGLFRIESIEIQLPPIDEQKRIVEVISSMDEVIQATEQTVADVKNLRSGLLSDVLSGEHEIPESYDVFVGAA